MEKYYKINDLTNSLIASINQNNKIAFLIGAGFSLNTNNDKLPNGIGKASDFEKIFLKKLLESLSKKDFIRIRTRYNKEENKYIFLAKELNNIKEGWTNVIVKEEILKIRGFEKVADLIHNNDLLNKLIIDKNFCSNIKLNESIEYFGKLSHFFNNKNQIKIYTSNFDPFIEITFTKNNINFHNLSHHKGISSNYESIIGSGIKLEHYHGFWTNKQLHNNFSFDDENIHRFIQELNQIEELYVIGFEGWKNDSMVKAITHILKNNKSDIPKIHWAIYGNKLNTKHFLKEFTNNNKIKIYNKIDSNKFFKLVYGRKLEKEIEKKLLNYKTEFIKKNEERYAFSFKEINYTYGKNINTRKRNNKKNNIINFIKNKISNGKSISISSKFGLGKTSILYFLIEELSDDFIFPIFIDLKNTNVIDLLHDDLNGLSKKIIELINNDENFNKSDFINTIKDKLEKKEIIVLLDGIDESNYKRNKLKEIIKLIGRIGNKVSVIFSFRTEFHLLLDILIKYNNILNNFYAIELKEWDNTFSDNYINNLNTQNEIKEKIKKFKILKSRPLFIDLLKKIFEIKIDININDNISDLYFNFIDLSIKTRISENENKKIADDIYNLLVEISIALYLEYRQFIEKDTDYAPSINLNTETIRLLCAKYSNITPNDFMQFWHKNNSKLNVLIPYNKNSIAFYHRSLFEYLVAHGAAKSIYQNKRCSNAWNVYQTDEISNYFVNEIQNILVKKDTEIFSKIHIAFNKELKNAFTNDKFDYSKCVNSNKQEYKKYLEQILSTFPKPNKEIISNNYPLFEYSERTEEVLFYIGKYFGRKNEKLLLKNFSEKEISDIKQKYLKIIDCIYSYKHLFPLQYYRTAAITKSRLEKNNEFAFSYLSRLFYDLSTEKRVYYKHQISTDINYYGREELEFKSKLSIDKILRSKSNEEILNKINPLDIIKVFSYFISLDTTSISIYKHKIKVLKKLQKKAETINCKNLYDLTESILFAYQRKTFDLRHKHLLTKHSLKQLINDAYEKRKNLLNSNNNVVRLFNGIGDGIDGLYIDYYNKNIVIIVEYTSLLFTTTPKNINIYVEIFNKINDLNVDNIILKKSWWFQKDKDKIIVLKGKLIENIECVENNVNFYVNPKHAKTGFFIDNRNIRKFLLDNSKNKKILNLCSFTSTLGTYAIKGGATKVINVEVDKTFLNYGKENYNLNKIDFKNNEFIQGDIRDKNLKNVILESISPSKKFDIIILDLPEWAPIPTFFEKTKNAYLNNNENFISLLNENGLLITTSCNHGFNRKRFNEVMMEFSTKHNLLENFDIKLGKLIDHPLDENKTNDYLKIKVLEKRR